MKLPPVSPRPCKLHSVPEHLQRVTDRYRRPIADFYFFPAEQLFYIQWHGHLTAAEIIPVATASLPWLTQLRPAGLLNDKRGTSGDWGEAMMWIEYEWIPRAKAAGLTVFAYVLGEDMMISFENAALIDTIRQALELRTFYGLGAAWKWLRQRTTRHAGVAA